MHATIKYVCDICGAEHRHEKDAMAHEATHFGVDRDTYAAWRELRRKAAATSRLNGQTNTPGTRAALDANIKELVDFEAAHGLSGKNQPILV